MATLIPSHPSFWDKYKDDLEKIKRASIMEAKESMMATAPPPQPKETLTDIVRKGAEMKSTGPGSVFHEIAKPTPTKEMVDLETKRMLAESVPQSVLDRILKTGLGTAEYLGLSALRPFYHAGEAIERGLGIEPIHPRWLTAEKIDRRLEELLPGGPTLRPAGELALAGLGYKLREPSPTALPAVSLGFTPPPPPERYWMGEKEQLTAPRQAVVAPSLPPEAPPGTYYQYVTPSGTIGFTDEYGRIPAEARGTAQLRRFEETGRGIYGGPPVAPPITTTIAEGGAYPGRGVVGPSEYMPDYSREYERIISAISKPVRSFAYHPGVGRFPITGMTRTQIDTLGDLARAIATQQIQEGAIAPYRQALAEKTMLEAQKTLREMGFLPEEKKADIFEKMMRGMQHAKIAGAPVIVPPGHTALFGGGEEYMAPMPREKGLTVYKDILGAVEKERAEASVLGLPFDFKKAVRERIQLYRPYLESTGEWELIPKEFRKIPKEEALAKWRAAYPKRPLEEFERFYQRYLME